VNTTSILNPIENPEAWDVITIGGTESPGICTLSGFTRNAEFDVKKGKGSLGATVTFVQRPPIEGSIKFQLWEPAHFEEWATFRKLLKYDPTKKAITALDIFHPALAEIDLKSVVCKSIGATSHDGKQLYSVTCEFLEYAPPPKKSAVGSPAGSKSNGTGASGSGTPPDPILDAQQKEIARLTEIAGRP
jgi:hypothetical protein